MFGVCIHSKQVPAYTQYRQCCVSYNECSCPQSTEPCHTAPRHTLAHSQGFSRGTSSHRGVTAHPSGRWEARIGIPGSRHVYLGLYEGEAEAARAYDGSLVRLRGLTAATNFNLAGYTQQLAEHYQLQEVRRWLAPCA
jgi:hypothetical protein